MTPSHKPPYLLFKIKKKRKKKRKIAYLSIIVPNGKS